MSEHIELTPEFKEAIVSFRIALAQFSPGGDSTGVIELPVERIGWLVLRALGLPGSLNEIFRAAEAEAKAQAAADAARGLTRAATSRPTISIGRRLKIMLRDDGKCVYCGTPDDLSIDHIIPISKGGSNEDDNLQTLCRRCNSSKRDRLPA